MLGGLSEVAEASGTGLVLVPAAVEAVQRAAIDGAVAYWLDDGHPVVRLLAARGIPLVRSADTATGPCVTIDDTAAGRSIGRHLAGLGHRDVAVLVSDPDLPYSRLRLAGIRAGLGAGARIRMVTAAGPLLNGTDRPSAIAADSDVLALGVLDAVRSHGLRPGRDLSVTGFDGVPAAQAAGLTTVRQPIRETGRLMGRMLLDPGFTERRVILPTELVVGASTGPAPDRSVR